MSKNILITLLIILFFICEVNGQIAFHDALILKRHIDANQALSRSSDTVFMILDKYIQPDIANTRLEIIGEVNASPSKEPNPFLEISGGDESRMDARIPGGIKKGLASLSGLDVTSMANELASFMIERSKEELTVAFFNRFKKFVKENSEFKVLFPKTSSSLENLLAYKYPEMLPALRTGFFEDLKSITYHFDDVLELPRYQELLKNFPVIRVAIRSVRLIYEIENGESHPADVLTKFAAFTEWKEALANSDFQNFGNTIKLASIFSNSLRSVITTSNIPDHKEDISKAWVNFNDLQSLVQDTIAFKIYLGLIYQQGKTENVQWFINNHVFTFTDIMAAQMHNLFLFENKMIEFIALANEVDKALETLNVKKRNNTAIMNDDYYNYINTSHDVIEYGLTFANVFIDNKHFVVSDYTKIARRSNDLYLHIYKQEYAQAIGDVVDIYKGIEDMLNNEKEVLLVSAKARTSALKKVSAFNNLNAGDVAVIAKEQQNTRPVELSKIQALYNSRGALVNYTSFIEKTTKYGLFMANMVNAKSKDDVAVVLETSALPVGSSSIKKYSQFNVAVQSYLGVYWSRSTSTNVRTEKAWDNKFGAIGPIGISFSYGFQKCGSLSLFTSLIDLGAIVDYKLNYDTVQTNTSTTVQVSKDYKIELGQIFSPGAYIVYGLPWNLPLSLGFGGQYGPGLNSIDSKNNTVVDNPYWRWNAFLGVDIPLLNLYNKDKRRR